jgi:uncharacterized protein YbjT (DUF2867 family)
LEQFTSKPLLAGAEGYPEPRPSDGSSSVGLPFARARGSERVSADLIAVCGATGRQGGAATRSLLREGWKVRALTRKPDRSKPRALADLGAEVVRADMNDPASLRPAFEGAHGVYSVQNGLKSGFDREVTQGRNVADAAKNTGVRHVVYGSAGTGAATGVPSWESKLAVEEHMRKLDLPFTILRAMAFMELMTDPSFFPAIGTWNIWPKLMGDDRPVPWLSVDDLGEIAAKTFAHPDRFLGKDLRLAGDLRTLAECRAMYTEVMGRRPRSFPVPMWMFDRFTKRDLTTMWRWCRTGPIPLDTSPTHAMLPSALTVRQWLEKTRQRTTAER